VTTREAVIAEAMTWRGTPWHHHARIKHAGVDCAQFPAAVYESVGLIAHVDPDYPRQWAMHHSEELFIAWILKCGAREIAKEQVQGGDLGVWKFGQAFSHAGIFISVQQVIHSVVRSGVQIDEIDRYNEFLKRESRFFTLWGDK
jgi:cell wall-associated NlpC family hydrolase